MVAAIFQMKCIVSGHTAITIPIPVYSALQDVEGA